MSRKPTYEELEQRVNKLEGEALKAKQTEKTLQKSEEWFRLLYERTPLSYQSLDENGYFIEVNQAWLDTFGYSREEVIGKSFGDFLHSDWVDHFKENFTRFKTVGEILGVEFEMFKKDGSSITVSFHGKIGHDKKGEFKQTHCILYDITEQRRSEEKLKESSERLEEMVEERSVELMKANEQLEQKIEERKQSEEALRESEERFRNVYETAPLAFVVWGKNTRVNDWNKKAEEIFGWSKEVVVGHNFFDFLIPEKDRPQVENVVDSLLKGDLLSHSINENLTKEGKIITCEWNNSALHDDDGNIIGAISLGLDITDRKQTEEERQILEAQLQQTQKMDAIATLAGGIAHQFNNALYAITGNIEFLEMDLSNDENIIKYTEPMKVSTKRMVNLSDQLLAYARGGKYQPKIISTNQILEDTVHLLKHLIDPVIRVEMDFSKETLNIKADLTQMQMILSAVLINSSEAIEGEGRIRITTSMENVDEEFVKHHPNLKLGHYVCLTIDDDGKGMNEETQSRIFEPFFTTKFEGRGLGMASAYGIVKNHDGWISVYSELGVGTVIRIYLPAIDVQVKAVEMPKVGLVKDAGTILLIEDEEIIIDVSRSMLERLGYHVIVAKDGTEAVNLVKTFEGDIALALLDIKLPDMEGGKVYLLIKDIRPNLKVIVCSGYSIEGPAQDILDAGAQGFIQKPFSLERLSVKLKEVLKDK
jgi:two-component system cell cycle sensor histidine kinase/response regulator CckA